MGTSAKIALRLLRLGAALGLGGFCTPALAAPFELPSLGDLATPALQKEAVRMAGILGAHRPFQPATPLGTSPGVEAAVTATMVQIPQKFFDELAAAGVSSSFSIRTLPVAKLQVQKGILPNVDVGASYLGLPQVRIYGADVKWAFLHPEEGPTWALRLCYSQATIRYFRVKSWSPQLVVSRKLNFADAYLGAEATWMTGRIRGSETVSGPGGSVTSTIDVSGVRSDSASAFLGLVLRIPVIGARFAIEGAYSFVKAHSLGASVGISW